MSMPLIHQLADALRAFENLSSERLSELGELSPEMQSCRDLAISSLANFDAWKASCEDWRKVAAPTVVEVERGGGTEQTISHPAFATIGISRVSGHADLFGSYVGHQHYISLHINPATMHRDAYSERIHGGIDRYIEVAMSEAQWAALIGSANVGSGVPCTLQHLSDPGQWYRGIPRLPKQQKAAERMSEQARDMVARSQERAKKAMEQLQPMIAKLPKKDQGAMQAIIDALAGESMANVEFQHKCLIDTQERLVSEAKVEIDATMANVAAQFGIESISQIGQILSANPAAALALLSAPKAGDQ